MIEPYPLGPAASDTGLPSQPGAATGRAARREKFLAAWLRGNLEPGDTVLATADGLVRPRRAREIAAGGIVLAGIAGIFPAWPDWVSHGGQAAHAVVALSIGAAGLWSAADALTRRRVCVAVSGRQLIVLQLNLARDPVRVLTAQPVSDLTVTAVRRSVLITAADDRELLAGRHPQTRLLVQLASRRARRAVIAAAGQGPAPFR